MADPRMKDLVKLMDAMRREMATNVDELRADMTKRFDQVDKRFDQVDKAIVGLDADLDRHMAKHREIEKDIESLKKRTPRLARRPPRADADRVAR